MKIHGICSYNGTNYSGWQKQTKDPSVQKEIEKVLSTVLNTETNIQGSGRTDAGVHANRQHFHFEVKNDKKVDIQKLQYSMNSMLPNDIKILSLEAVNDDFHARFSAKGKRYIYKISRQAKDPFKENLVWLNPQPFDLELFKQALNQFLGTHNFQDFSSKEEDEANFVRTISKVEVCDKDDEISITFEGDGFMRYQIRFMIGTALAVATKEIEISFIEKHLKDGKNREIVHYKAPGQGLYLDEVFY